MARLTYHEDTVKEILIRCVQVMMLTWVSNKLAKKIHRKVLRSKSFPAELSNPSFCTQCCSCDSTVLGEHHNISSLKERQ